MRRKPVSLRDLNFSSKRRGLLQIRPVAEPGPLRLAGGQGRAGTLADQSALLLGQRGVEVQHEGVSIRAEFGHDEGHTLRHQAGDEGDVTREAIELGNEHRAFCAPRGSEGFCKLRSAVQCIRPLAGLHLDELSDDRDLFSLANRCTAARWASMPSPDRPCRCVETR